MTAETHIGAKPQHYEKFDLTQSAYLARHTMMAYNACRQRNAGVMKDKKRREIIVSVCNLYRHTAKNRKWEAQEWDTVFAFLNSASESYLSSMISAEEAQTKIC